MAEATYIQWNIPNQITITLMAAVGLIVFGIGYAYLKSSGWFGG